MKINNFNSNKCKQRASKANPNSYSKDDLLKLARDLKLYVPDTIAKGKLCEIIQGHKDLTGKPMPQNLKNIKSIQNYHLQFGRPGVYPGLINRNTKAVCKKYHICGTKGVRFENSLKSIENYKKQFTSTLTINQAQAQKAYNNLSLNNPKIGNSFNESKLILEKLNIAFSDNDTATQLIQNMLLFKMIKNTTFRKSQIDILANELLKLRNIQKYVTFISLGSPLFQTYLDDYFGVPRSVHIIIELMTERKNAFDKLKNN